MPDGHFNTLLRLRVFFPWLIGNVRGQQTLATLHSQLFPLSAPLEEIILFEFMQLSSLKYCTGALRCSFGFVCQVDKEKQVWCTAAHLAQELFNPCKTFRVYLKSRCSIKKKYRFFIIVLSLFSHAIIDAINICISVQTCLGIRHFSRH